MAEHNAEWYIRENDFEGALGRFNSTSNRWKEHWWNAVETIFRQCADLAKKYFLDPVKRIVTRLAEGAIEEGQNICYWIRLFNENDELIYHKVGTTCRNFNARIKEIMRCAWAKEERITRYEILNIWNCGNLPPEGLESELRGELIKKYKGRGYVRNDRIDIRQTQEEPSAEEMNFWATQYLMA